MMGRSMMGRHGLLHHFRGPATLRDLNRLHVLAGDPTAWAAPRNPRDEQITMLSNSLLIMNSRLLILNNSLFIVNNSLFIVIDSLLIVNSSQCIVNTSLLILTHSPVIVKHTLLIMNHSLWIMKNGEESHNPIWRWSINKESRLINDASLDG